MLNRHGFFLAVTLVFILNCISTMAQPIENKTCTVNGASFKMIAVEGGTFTMGCNSAYEDECETDEKPAHVVTLSNYYIGEFEVTHKLWGAVTGKAKNHPYNDDLPISIVDWDEAQNFIKQLYQVTGLQFRLPTEAEWEFAAKGGNKSKGYKYSGGNNLDLVAWHDKNCNELHPVGKKQPNELGIYDMCGNVWEWCQDTYCKYNSSDQINPCMNDPSFFGSHVLRGGCYSPITYRMAGYPKFPLQTYGFRLAISGDEAEKPFKEQKKEHKEKVIHGNAQLENRFSVSPNKVVSFSKGNLQYQASTGKWRFADSQWDYIGVSNNKISSNNSDWIDLFGCGTGDNPTKSSTNMYDYKSFYDWGNNYISNGNGKNWRTLTVREWIYVICERETTSGIRNAHAIVDGVNGLILLPDNWKKEYYEFSIYNSATAVFSSNRVSKQDWIDKLEAHGAIFLPASGIREGTTISKVDDSGFYWSSWMDNRSGACVLISNGRVCANEFFPSRRGGSVRLVCDLEK